ncbi:MAG: tyrosine recombinase XerD [Candidatus Planktophila sp.]|nr:tyrosine recombinase XerD [Candidatus Planktophila sp.]
MQFEEVAKGFLDHLQIERALSANSIAAYKRDLAKFENFLNERSLNLASVSEEDIVMYEVGQKAAGLSLASINRSTSALKTFYKYLAREHSISDPTTSIATNKLARKLPKALTISEMESLINSAEKSSKVTSLRDKAILEILYGTGARVSEIIGINVGDFDKTMLQGSQILTLKLRGKGAKERIVPVGFYAKTALDNYLVRLRPQLAAKSNESRSNSALFLNSRGTRLSRQSAWQIVIAAADACDLSGKVSPHVFRHSYATHLLDGGADIRVVQELLGHSSVTTTQIYTLITIDKVREDYATSHPRAR